ncbi:unnamed protein product [Sphagnum troendelagicum]|uniref:Bis(5'-adenosyl)-triphosphatase n=1 Tax=Sphagnum troendelagicum TaxID=128251 RepID=A0ABP0TDD1_9BRYO
MHCANCWSPFIFSCCKSFTRRLSSGRHIRGLQFCSSTGKQAALPTSWHLPLATVLRPARSDYYCSQLQTSPGDKRSSRAGFARISGNKSDRMSTSDVPHYATPQMDEIFYFGKFKIDPSEVFLVTDHSYAFVNLKPVVPDHKDGINALTAITHVLVSSRRVVNRFLDLTSEEVSDLWLTAKYVGQKLEPFYNASSLTFTIQDGPKAGQTVPHVHVHILPRKDGDFENNDEIYDVIDEKEKELAKKLNLDLERKDRTFEEMANEAANLRALF